MKKILAVLMALCMLFSAAALADEAELTVEGIGRVYVEADQACIYLGLSLTDEDVAALQQQANETIDAICAALEAAGVDGKNISTNYFYINPRYDYSGDVEQLIGYTLNNSLCIITDQIDQVGVYIDAAFAAGANTFDSITFSVKNDSEARKQALEIAISNARSKAETIAAATGKALGELIEVSEDNDFLYDATGNSAAYMESAVAADGAATTVRASQIEVRAGVKICYELK